MNNNEKETKKNGRNYWFDHVRKTRKKMSRGKKIPVKHRDAMREASTTWPALKKKLLKKIERAQKKLKSDGVVKL